MQTQVQVQSFNVQQTSPQEGREAAKMKKILRGFGITEAVIGLICCVMGILLMANVYGQPIYYKYNDYYYSGSSYSSSSSRTSLGRLYLFNLGEGLWCGIWVFIAGCLGAACGKKTVTPCLLNAYLAFSIVASVFAITMFGINVPFALIYRRYSFGVGVEGTLAFLSFTAFVICIVSACYCCCASVVITKSPSCCGTCCESGIQPTGGYVVSTVGTNAGMQPVVQGSPMFVQGQVSPQQGTTMYMNHTPQMTTHQCPQVAMQQPSSSHGVAQQSPQGAGPRCDQKKQADGPPAYEIYQN